MSQTKHISKNSEFLEKQKGHKISIMCQISTHAYFGLVSGLHTFHNNMYGLAQRCIVNVKRKPEKNSISGTKPLLLS